MALLYGRARRLTAQNGDFRPGQCFEDWAIQLMLENACDLQVKFAWPTQRFGGESL
jgi:hypothetical protein